MTPTAVINKEQVSAGAPAPALKQGQSPPIIVPADAAADLDEPLGEVLCVDERLVIAPCSGRFRSSFGEYTVSGQFVTEGQVVGTVVSRDGDLRPVTSPFSGWVMGHLVSDGGPVSASAPVLWLRRQ